MAGGRVGVVDLKAGQVVKAAAARADHGLLNLYAGVLFMLLESPHGPVRARPCSFPAGHAQ